MRPARRNRCRSRRKPPPLSDQRKAVRLDRFQAAGRARLPAALPPQGEHHADRYRIHAQPVKASLSKNVNKTQ
jgi:hypothetical protein